MPTLEGTPSAARAAPARPDPDTILGFAWFPSNRDRGVTYATYVSELAQKAQRESWDDPTNPNVGNNEVLTSYLHFTFRRLKEEGKIVFVEARPASDGAQALPAAAAFNTGLFTENYEQIFAYFEKNTRPGMQDWVFRGWHLESDRALRRFDGMEVKPARYFEKPADLIYNPDWLLIPDLDHILDDNAGRFPEWLRDDAFKRRIFLQGAIQDAEKRVRINWRTAVPQYYFPPTGAPGHIQLLLPLSLTKAGRTDLALVVDPQERSYRANTALPLNLAYKNARLISRQETEWLGTASTGPQVPNPQAG